MTSNVTSGNSPVLLASRASITGYCALSQFLAPLPVVACQCGCSLCRCRPCDRCGCKSHPHRLLYFHIFTFGPSNVSTIPFSCSCALITPIWECDKPYLWGRRTSATLTRYSRLMEHDRSAFYSSCSEMSSYIAFRTLRFNIHVPCEGTPCLGLFFVA